MTQACRDAVYRGYGALKGASHAGLLLSSYLQSDEDADRAGLLRLACEAPLNAKEVYTRAYKLFEERVLSNTVNELVEVDGRAVIGLGIESPLETGLALHHTYGVPYLPGSALKGLAAHYCHQVWGAGESEDAKKFRSSGTYYQIIFGTTEDAGHIIFNDAWIMPDSLDRCLAMDVMAVHHPDYYKKKDVAPSDFDDPIPITFLSVQGKFRLSLRSDIDGENGKKWARLAMNLLLEALENWGVGAKTSSGYGRMKKVQGSPSPSFRGSPNRPSIGAVPPSVYTGSGRTTWVPPCKSGERVSATISAEKTKSGKLKAVCTLGQKEWLGHIHNSEDVPGTVKAGDRVTLVVKSISMQEISFYWPK